VVGASFDTAEHQFAEIGAVFARAATLLEHAEWLVACGDAAAATPYLDEAAAEFEPLSARPWVERAARLREPATRIGAGTVVNARVSTPAG
jgi:hypothetical protein